MSRTEPRNRHIEALAPAVRNIAQRRIDDLRRHRDETAAAVDQVVATLDDAAAGRCACGCGEQIVDSSPSAYYASSFCQQKWMARHVDNPNEVYGRRDAADYPVLDSAQVALNEPVTASPAARRGEHVGHVHIDIGVDPAAFHAWLPHRTLIYGPGRFEHPLSYRRTCPSCSRFMEPNIYGTGDGFDPATFGTEEPYLHVQSREWEQECSGCGTAIVGTVHVPAVHPSRELDGWTLELHTPYGRVRSTVTRLALARTSATTQAGFIADTWASMERDLARFEREWRGRAQHRETQMMFHINGLSVGTLRFFGNATP